MERDREDVHRLLPTSDVERVQAPARVSRKHRDTVAVKTSSPAYRSKHSRDKVSDSTEPGRRSLGGEVKVYAAPSLSLWYESLESLITDCHPRSRKPDYSVDITSGCEVPLHKHAVASSTTPWRCFYAVERWMRVVRQTTC